MFPSAPPSIPTVTRDEMLEVDRLMVEHYGITVPQMMENAGRAVARVGRDLFLDGDLRGRRVLVLAGAGGNGGGGLTAARHLASGGAEVVVRTSRPMTDYEGTPLLQLAALVRMGLEVLDSGWPPDSSRYDLVVDALVGYGLRGAPRGEAAHLIGRANRLSAPILSLDIPSGVDATTGAIYDPAICAHATVTLALPKCGLRIARRTGVVGDLYLADIGVPLALLDRMGLSSEPIFGESDILRIPELLPECEPGADGRRGRDRAARLSWTPDPRRTESRP